MKESKETTQCRGDARLSRIFSEAAKPYRFDEVSAEFVAFKDLKVRWQRTYRMADFMISDYMSDAPDDVLEEFADTILGKVVGTDEGEYPKAVTDWITSVEFHQHKQPIYLRRSKGLTRSPIGNAKNLLDSYRRLQDDGLVELDPDLCISWTRSSSVRKVGHCSVIMDVVAISSALDEENVPDYVLDYCLYHELCHLAIGFDPSGREHEKRFAVLETMHPRRDDAEAWLRRIDMYA